MENTEVLDKLQKPVNRKYKKRKTYFLDTIQGADLADL